MGSTHGEYQPLLLGLDSHAQIPDLASETVEEFLEHRPVAIRWYPRLVAWESRLLWLLSGSSIIVSIFNYMLSFVTLMFTGHLGALELAGASIASVGIQGLAYGIMLNIKNLIVGHTKSSVRLRAYMKTCQHLFLSAKHTKPVSRPHNLAVSDGEHGLPRAGLASLDTRLVIQNNQRALGTQAGGRPTVPPARGMGIEAPLALCRVCHCYFDFQLHAEFSDSDVYQTFRDVGTSRGLDCHCGNSRACLWGSGICIFWIFFFTHECISFLETEKGYTYPTILLIITQCIQLGMASAVQTVCGQAYGAKKYAAMGIICQRAIILHLGAAILLTFIYWYSEAILKAIGQSESIAAQGQVFARGLILQLYAFAISCPMQRFLQAQNIVNPLAYIAVGVFLLHTLLTWIAVYVLGYGLFGAALTLSLSWWLLVIIQGLYIVFSPSCKETWTGFSVKAFKGIWPYFKLTVASAVMLCLEIWYFQGLVLISGLLPSPTISLDSISICMNYLNWDMQFMLGLATAASIRVSNELGAGHPMVAKFSVIVVNSTTILISIIFSAIVLIFRVALSKLFTSDSEVIAAVSDLTPVLAISVFLNGIQPILSGVAIGSGWQAVVAYVNLGTYYIIGLPIGCVLGFKTSLGAIGIWWGMIVGVVLQTLALFILTVRTNWNAEVAKAAERLKQSADEETLVDQLCVDGI
ncbi:hypothetical protein RJ640_028716 [Escallonia rubra]|uniref:Protein DETOXIFICATION n=1 Tax=Escallonia rubra TaxID=112253 RepID=A0AA88RH14_9ASTE|nr:hypothetical protein RJ640_028716 [Escallonia rubra]